jgi:hypothetical protein
MLEQALKYIFWLSLVLIIVAYYAGSVNVLNAAGQQLGNTILFSTGRNAQGQFAAYPKQG